MVFPSTDACVSTHATLEFMVVGFAVMALKPETSPCTGNTQTRPTFSGRPIEKPPTDSKYFQLATSAVATGATSVATNEIAANAPLFIAL
jgi:hypothetical protein